MVTVGRPSRSPARSTSSRRIRVRSLRGRPWHRGDSASGRETLDTVVRGAVARRVQERAAGPLIATLTLAGRPPATETLTRARAVRSSAATRTATLPSGRAVTSPLARHTEADSAGSRSRTVFPAAAPSLGASRSPSQTTPGESVATLTVTGSRAAFRPTRSSRPDAGSKRLNTSVPWRAARTTAGPIARAGFAARTAASSARWAPTGLPTTSNDEPVPIGGEPTRSSARHVLTAVGNRSCRASLSPPAPMIPNSSPYSTIGAPRSR